MCWSVLGGDCVEGWCEIAARPRVSGLSALGAFFVTVLRSSRAQSVLWQRTFLVLIPQQKTPALRAGVFECRRRGGRLTFCLVCLRPRSSRRCRRARAAHSRGP